MIRIGLVDDQQLFTVGIAMVIDSQPDMRVGWRAENGHQALAYATRDIVDIVLMDVQMPVMDGIAATTKLTESDTTARIIILTTFDTDEYVIDGLAAGASGFLLKDTDPEELLAAIRTVYAGEAVISARSTRRLLTAVRPLLAGSGPAAHVPLDRATRSALESLTPRELDILVAVAKGWSNTEISQRLFISMPTVKTHVGHVLAKLGARDRIQAVLFAFRAGVVDRADLLTG